MKKFATHALILVLAFTFTEIKAQYIPDGNFAAKISLTCPSCIDSDHYLTSDAQNLTHLDIEAYVGSMDFTGLDGFTNLQYFKAYYIVQEATLPALPVDLDTLILDQVYCSSLPTLPSSLRYFYCRNNLFTSLPTLPDSLTYLDCRNNLFTSLPALPDSLTYLDCSSNNLSSLPTLPASLKVLYCHQEGFYFFSLPDLPSNLIELDCSWNVLSSLPSLPSTLEYLNCSDIGVSTLPSLPSTLSYLNCNYNGLEHLPALPSSLRHLDASYCSLFDVPVVPDSLYHLYLGHNSITSIPNFPSVQIWPYGLDIDIDHNPISCLPLIPDFIYSLNIGGTNINCLPNIPSNLYYYFNLPLCEAGNMNGCFAYPSIQGNVYGDFNNNGVFDSAVEFHASNVIVQSNPGNYIGISDINGNFKIWAPLNSADTVTVLPLPAYYLPPSNHYVVSFDSLSGQQSVDNDFGIVPINSGANLETVLTSEFFLPGFDTKLFVTIRNVGTDDLDGLAILTFDPLLTFVYADQNGVPSGNTVAWAFTGVHSFQTKTFVATINSPVNLVLGTELNNSASGSVTGAADIDESNNSQNIVNIVVGSYDPNDKQVNDATITMDDLANAKYLEYTIHFQNTGTAPATFINVVDTLSDKLDPLTFEMIASSHQYDITLANDLTKTSHPVFVKWLFNNIQLPDSSVDFTGSQGFVKFRIKPKSNLIIGDEIQNSAGIYFDFNAPIVTNIATTDVVVASSVSTADENLFKAVAFPNPAGNSCTIHLTHINSPEMELEMTDAIGSTVMQKRISVHHESFDLNLNLMKLERGVYFVSIRSFDRVQVLKLVKE